MNASLNEDDLSNFRCTYGALFFGVPSQGMNVDAMAAMVQGLPAQYNLNLSNEQMGFRLRKRQHQEFCEAFSFRDSRIVQFLEQRKTPTMVLVSQKPW